MEWKIGNLLPTTEKKTSLVFQHEWHYDNGPPNLSQFFSDFFSDENLNTELFVPYQAQKSHRIYKLTQ